MIERPARDLSGDELEAALACATRRQAIGLALVGGTACFVRRRS